MYIPYKTVYMYMYIYIYVILGLYFIDQKEHVQYDLCNLFGMNALHLAVASNISVEVVRALIEKGAMDLEAVDIWGRTPLLIAIYQG